MTDFGDEPGAVGDPVPLSATAASGRRARVLIADDFRLLVDTLAHLLAAEFTVLPPVTDGEALFAAAVRLRPDMAIIDLNMPRLSGFAAAHALRRELPECRLVVLTAEQGEEVAARAFACGVAGFLLKTDSAEEVLHALRRIAAGGRYLSAAIAGGDVTRLPPVAEPHCNSLSPREREVLCLAAAGVPMKEIGRKLGITPRTVAFHKYRGMAVLGLRHQADLLRHALERGWLNPPA